MTAATTATAAARAWQYRSTSGGLEKNLTLASVTPPVPKPTEHLVRVLYCALNPVDYKPAEIPLVGRALVSYPATPGVDFAGRIVKPAEGSDLKEGDLVFGGVGDKPFAAGGLADYATANPDRVARVPEGVDPKDAATVCVAGLTAYNTIVPFVKEGDEVLINGGTGGCGVFGIQIAKAKGCRVTATCSTKNVEFVKELGTDHVIDYTKGDLVKRLKDTGKQYDHFVDNVGSDSNLYWQCHEFTKPGALYMSVGAEPSLGIVGSMLKKWVMPKKREFRGFFLKPKREDLEQMGAWMKEGKVRTVIDSQFKMEDAPKAFERLKTKRATGKIVVEVAHQA
ncbi:putative zinc-type alcohol dehydrogenase-like protein C16A3.02c [Fimicolochytrium jonesii]|uniref:putative zinc-type alcohol dehydrogenase-like protein C16A3.02c n=1 Tax=Fimicolochytrium jonesii TaxID=1396493 RepID=UPI0022FEBAAC|nr:putative zinc-type alcohol dehydrogenase-like protein C16A3.02c [Fimicolochytrium jonesii]KAI8820709.1 putative zinc-type alcohol dehydrogenase-like protein C16A3.02c [Fimicolochytrium jonesii]